MDRTTTIPCKAPLTNIPPVQLWIFKAKKNDQTIIEYLKKIFCNTSNHFDACFLCTKITHKQHPSIEYYQPPYTLESIEPIKRRIGFMLEPNEKFFFFIDQVEKLLPNSANALLKTLEETPPGYHFILHTDHPKAVLPTILSRSVIFHSNKESDYMFDDNLQSIINHFLNKTIMQADSFLSLLETTPLNNDDTTAIIMYLLAEENKKTTTNIHMRDHDWIEILRNHLSLIDFTTNNKFILKNLFIQRTEFEKSIKK